MIRFLLAVLVLSMALEGTMAQKNALTSGTVKVGSARWNKMLEGAGLLKFQNRDASGNILGQQVADRFGAYGWNLPAWAGGGSAAGGAAPVSPGGGGGGGGVHPSLVRPNLPAPRFNSGSVYGQDAARAWMANNPQVSSALGGAQGRAGGAGPSANLPEWYQNEYRQHMQGAGTAFNANPALLQQQIAAGGPQYGRDAAQTWLGANPVPTANRPTWWDNIVHSGKPGETPLDILGIIQNRQLPATRYDPSNVPAGYEGGRFDEATSIYTAPDGRTFYVTKEGTFDPTRSEGTNRVNDPSLRDYYSYLKAVMQPVTNMGSGGGGGFGSRYSGWGGGGGGGGGGYGGVNNWLNSLRLANWVIS